MAFAFHSPTAKAYKENTKIGAFFHHPPAAAAALPKNDSKLSPFGSRNAVYQQKTEM